MKFKSSENMGNCCSSKRATGYVESTESTPDDSVHEILGKDQHHHHHHHHHGTKRNSTNQEMKIMEKRKSKGNTNNSSNTSLIMEEEKQDLIPNFTNLTVSSISNTNHSSSSSSNSLKSTQIIVNNNSNSNSTETIEVYEPLYPKTTGSSNGIISSSGSHGLAHSYPYTHSRQLSTEKVSNCGPQFKTPLSALPQHMKMEGFQRTKHNSTSSLYINSTLSTPDNDEILRCMANALLYHIEKGTQHPQPKMIEIFSEEKYPITKGKLDLRSIPTVEAIYKFVRDIFKAEKLDSECAIMCLAYIERIITFTGTTLHPTNWRRIVLSALILASKVWEDQSVWNVDFLPVFDNLTATDLNQLERQFLSLLQYNVSLTASIYAKYYFELRTFSTLDSSQFPLDPLDKAGVKKLEDRSRVKPFKRSASVDQINPAPEPHNRAVLN